MEVREKFYLFELGGVDIILGVAWLASLGEVKIKWGNLKMTFSQMEEKVLIGGTLP